MPVKPLDEFFKDYYESVLAQDEIITEVFVPRLAANSGGAYLKFLPRTADDYATVSAAAVLTLDKNKKTVSDVRIALGSVGVTPIRATAAATPTRASQDSSSCSRHPGARCPGR